MATAGAEAHAWACLVIPEDAHEDTVLDRLATNRLCNYSPVDQVPPDNKCHYHAIDVRRVPNRRSDSTPENAKERTIVECINACVNVMVVRDVRRLVSYRLSPPLYSLRELWLIGDFTINPPDIARFAPSLGCLRLRCAFGDQRAPTDARSRLSRRFAAIPYDLSPLQNVTHLELGGEFNMPLAADTLPRMLTHLILGDAFDEPVDDLPPHLVHLAIGNAFSQPLPKNLPVHLVHLELGNSFNWPLDGVLPDGLACLSLGRSYKQPMCKLPTRVNRLSIRNGDYQMEHVEHAASPCLHLVQIGAAMYLRHEGHFVRLPVSRGSTTHRSPPENADATQCAEPQASPQDGATVAPAPSATIINTTMAGRIQNLALAAMGTTMLGATLMALRSSRLHLQDAQHAI